MATALPVADLAIPHLARERSGPALAGGEGADAPHGPELPFGPSSGSGGATPGEDGAQGRVDGAFPRPRPGASPAFLGYTGSPLLDQVLGASRLAGHDVHVPDLPLDKLAPDLPLRAAILGWIAATGADVPPQELAVELARADALPLPLQRDLAILVLSATEATLLQREALARIAPEDLAWIRARPELGEQLAQGIDTPETRALAALAGLVDTQKSIAASLLLLQAVEVTRGSLARHEAAQAAESLAGVALDPVTRLVLDHLAVGASSASDAEKVRFAATVVALAAGVDPTPSPLPPATFQQALDDLLAQTGQPVDADAYADAVARASRLPPDLDAAIGRLLRAQARAVDAAHPDALTPDGQARALVDLLHATADALPVLEKHQIYWHEAPEALRLGQWEPDLRAGWAVEHLAFLLATRGAPDDLVRAGGLLLGVGLPDAEVPRLGFAEAYAMLAREHGAEPSAATLAQVREAADALPAAVGDAAARMMSGAAAALRLHREALADLSPEQRALLDDPALDAGALYLRADVTEAEVARLARLAEAQAAVDRAKLVQAGLVGILATMQAREILAGAGAYALQGEAEPVPTGWRALLARLLPFQSARAQAPAAPEPPAIPCRDIPGSNPRNQTASRGFMGTLPQPVENDCANDVLLRLTNPSVLGGSLDNPQANADLLVITGNGGSRLTPRHAWIVRDCVSTPMGFTCSSHEVGVFGAPRVHLDLGGDDIYQVPVAVTYAGQPQPVALHLDVAGRDAYLDPTGQYDRSFPVYASIFGEGQPHPTQASAWGGGVAVLVDAGGDDRYVAQTRSQGYARWGVGLLHDAAGHDRYLAQTRSQGYAGERYNAGLGLLLDGAGGDRYVLAEAGQGYGLGGALLDLGGEDAYETAKPPQGVPIVHLDVVPGGNATSLHARGDGRAWVDGPDALNLGLGLDRDVGPQLADDTDGDGDRDFLEIIHGSDPANPHERAQDGTEARTRAYATDRDGDGWPDYLENAFSTDPRDSREHPAGLPGAWRIRGPAGEVSPDQGYASTGRFQGSGKLVDLRLPLQKAGSVDEACAQWHVNVSNIVLNGTRITPVANPRTDCTRLHYAGQGDGTSNLTTPASGGSGKDAYTLTFPLGILAIGDLVDTTYDVDYLFVLDLGGSDKFRNRAGGALPLRMTPKPGTTGVGEVAFLAPSYALSLDWRPDGVPTVDRYAPADGESPRSYAHGAYYGVLVDVHGDDEYVAGNASQGAMGGILLDLGGSNVFRAGNLTQGANLIQDADPAFAQGLPDAGRARSADASARRAAPGALLSLGGMDDVYHAGAHSQGFARGAGVPQCADERCSPLGYGLLLDAGGDDRYVATGDHAQGVGGFRGVGALVDRDGDDRYAAGGVASQGSTVSATFQQASENVHEPGAGLLVDLAGSDRYAYYDAWGEHDRSAARADRLTVQRQSGDTRVNEAQATVSVPSDLGLHLDATAGALAGALAGGGAAGPQGVPGFHVHMPNARLAIGADGPTAYDHEFAFVVDLGGANTYNHSAAGLVREAAAATSSSTPGVTGSHRTAASLFPVSFLFDAGSGASVYNHSRPFAQGAGYFGVGVLVDAGGRDVFLAAPAQKPALASGWSPVPPLVDGTVGEDEWRNATTYTLAAVGTRDSRYVQPVTLRVTNDHERLYLAIEARSLSGKDRHRDGLRIGFDTGGDADARPDARGFTGLDALRIDPRASPDAKCAAVDLGAASNGASLAVDTVRHDAQVACRAVGADRVVYEISKPLVEVFPTDPQDMAIPLSPRDGLRDVVLGIHLALVENNTRETYAWPPGTTLLNGDLSYRLDANLSDELEDWAKLGLANLGGNGTLPDNPRPTRFVQGAAIAGVGIHAMIGLAGSHATLVADDYAQAYAAYGGLAVLHDASGSDTYRAKRFAQGAAQTQGVALFLEADGNENYVATGTGNGHADATSVAFFYDLAGMDEYARELGPSLPIDPETARPSPPHPRGNQRIWLQGQGVGVDYVSDDVARASAASLVPAHYRDVQTRLSVKAYNATAQTCAGSGVPQTDYPNTPPRDILSGDVCLEAQVEFKRSADQTSPDVVTVDSVDFLVDGVRVATVGSSSGAQTLFRHRLNVSELDDGVRLVTALATFRVQTDRGVAIFQDKLHDNPDLEPAQRKVLVNNPPRVSLQLAPTLDGVAAYSPVSSLAPRTLDVDYAVSKDAGEDLLELLQNWTLPPQNRNLPCRPGAERLCNVVSLYFQEDNGEAALQTERGKRPPYDQGTVKREFANERPFVSVVPTLQTPLVVYKENAFHVRLDNRTALSGGDFYTEIALALQHPNGAPVLDGNGQPVLLAHGVFHSRQEAGSTGETLAALGPVFAEAKKGADLVMKVWEDLNAEGNPLLEALRLVERQMCAQQFREPCLNYRGDFGYDWIRICTWPVDLASLCQLLAPKAWAERATTTAGPLVGETVETGFEALADNLGGDGSSADLHWRDFHLDARADGEIVQDQGDTVVVPPGYRLQLSVQLVTEGGESSGIDASDTYAEAWLSSCRAVLPPELHGDCKNSLVYKESTFQDLEDRAGNPSLAGLNLPRSVYQFGRVDTDTRLDVRVPTLPRTVTNVFVEPLAGGENLTLREPAALEGDVPGSPRGPDGSRWTERQASLGADVGGVPLADGFYRLHVEARDEAGSTPTRSSSLLLLDRTAPSSHVTTPAFAGRALVRDNVLRLNFAVVEPHEASSGHARTYLFARQGDAPWPTTPTAVLPPGATEYHYPVPSTGVAYSFMTVAQDRVGNVEGLTDGYGSLSAALQAAVERKDALGPGAGYAVITIDKGEPSIVGADIIGGRLLSYRGTPVHYVRAGADVAFRIEARDNLGGTDIGQVHAVFMKVNESSPDDILVRSFPVCSPCAGQAYVLRDWGRHNTDKEAFPDGVWSVAFDVYDRAANRVTYTLGQVLLDSRAPTLHPEPVVYPPGQVAAKPDDRVTVRLRAEDAWGIDRTTMRVDVGALNASGTLPLTPRIVDQTLYYEASFRLDDPGLQNGLYHLDYVVADNAGNLARGFFVVEVQFVAFEVVPGSVEVVNLTHDGFTLRWRTTGPATSLVKYGTGPFDLRFRTPANETFATEHEVRVQGLKSSTRYFLRAVSIGTSGYANESATLDAVTATAIFLQPASPAEGDAVSGLVPVAFRGGLRDLDEPVTYTLEVQPRPEAPFSFVTMLTERGENHTLWLNSTRFLDGDAYRLRLTAEAGVEKAVALLGPFVADNTPPRVTVIAPLVATSDTTPRLVAEVHDARSGFGDLPVRLEIDGEPVPGGVTIEPGPEGTLRVTYAVASALEAGPHAFALVATDRAGGQTLERWTVIVDGDAPEIRVGPVAYHPGPAAGRADGTATINVTLRDASGVASAVADVRAVSSLQTVRLARVLGTDAWIGTFPLTVAAAEARRAVPVTAVDHAGNARTLDVEIVVDNAPPRVAELRVAETEQTRVVLATTASEPVRLAGTATAPGRTPVRAEGDALAREPRLVFDGLLPSHAYTFTVQALDAAGNAATTTGRFETLPDLVPPGDVRGLTVTDLLNGTLRLSWLAATDDVGVSHYRVYRSADGVQFHPVADVASTTYDDVGLPLETAYVYQVVAVDHGGNEGASADRLSATATSLPRLSFGLVAPTAGTPSTTFRYTIDYRSPGGVPPTYVRILLDGVYYNMTRADEREDLRDGATYVYAARLAPHKRGEPHAFAFEASDGRYTVRFPADGSLLRGPLVAGDADDVSATSFAGFAQRVPLGGVAGATLALALAAVAVGLLVRKKQEGSK